MEAVKAIAGASRYAKGRDTMFTILLCGGVWMAADIRNRAENIEHRLAAVSDATAKLESRIAALERPTYLHP